MRKGLGASAISFLVFAFGFGVTASPCVAQNARDVMAIFGAIMQSTMIQATQAEWRKLSPANLSCADETLRQRGISRQALINNGITPSDTRISDVLANCRSQNDLQQLANTRSQPTTEATRTNPVFPQTVQPSNGSSKYRLDKIPLGSSISFESSDYKEYQCKPSDQFPGFTWCQKQRTERVHRGAYLSSYSMLHTKDGQLFYLNRYLEPAFFDPGEVTGDIDRLSRTFGEQPRSIAMPQRAPGTTGVIAYWGEVILEPLDATATATLASGHSPGGMLVDFAGDFQESIRQNLPIYRVAGGPGFVWAESHDANGRGRLRFFEIDASILAASGTSAQQANAYQPPTAAPDPWKDCQSSDAETRLAGCTKVIEAKGPDRGRLADAFDGRCSAYNQKQQYQPALSDCKTAIDLNPKYSYAYANLGATYLGLNDPASALSALNKAVVLRTNFIWSRLSRAKAFEASGSNNEDALKEYQYALLIDPANQAAKDGVMKLIPGSTPPAAASDSCLGDTNEQAKYIAVSATVSSATAMESAASAISSSAQTYRAKLISQNNRVDRLAREKEAADKQQSVVIGSLDDRKKILNEVQRLTEVSSESQARLNAISEKISEREGQLKQLEAAKNGRARLTEIRQELAKLSSALAAAERDLHQRTSERDDASSKAQQRAIEIAKSLVQSEGITSAKENAESCVRQIKAGIDALDQKADEIRQKQSAQAAKALQVNAENLLSDLSEFAQKNSNLVPLEVGPLVAGLKGALGAKNSDKTSNAFSSLQRRLDEIPEFKRFRTSREEARQQAAKAELEELGDTARTISDFAENYAKRNITSDSAQDLVKLKGSLSEALITPEAEALKLTISQAEKELERQHLDSDYRDYRAKHPIQSRKSTPATTDRNRLLVDGPLDETLIFVNESGRAAVVRNIRGDLIFDRGNASLCFLHENTLDAFAMSELKRKVIEKGARSVDVSASRCGADSIENYDIVVLNRGLFGTLPAVIATAMLNAVDKGEVTLLGSISDRELQIARNGDSIKSLQLENDVLRKAIDGFGLVSIENGTSVVCQTVADRQKAHEGLVVRASDRLQDELGSSPRAISTSIEGAFVSAKRGQCGAIYGASKDLRDLIASLQRDKLNYHVLPIWFSPADVEAEQKQVAEAEARNLREQQQLEQKRKDDQLRADIQRRQTDAERSERQEGLQKENGVLARGLQEKITDEVKEFATKSELDDKTYVRQRWPALATWYRERIADEWELESVASELRDYGMVKWKNRVLEAGFVAITFKMKHRGLGEHQQKCFQVGFVADREFEVARDPISAPCDDESAVNRYKTAHEFSSKWLAD
jgi:hypothetical protein